MKLNSYYQKIVETRSGNTHGYEAFIRASQMGQYIRPTNLFKAAYEKGSVVELDNTALDICIRNFDRQGKLFVNCTPKTLSQSNLIFPDNTNFSNIVLEITESARFDVHVEEIANYLKPYRDRGMQVAIDDYGSGWSNLPRIEQLTPEYLKLDHNIIQNVHTSTRTQDIVAGMVSFCTRAGIRMIAEGVEQTEQHTVLRMLGVTLAQGFYYDMPKPFTEATVTALQLE